MLLLRWVCGVLRRRFGNPECRCIVCNSLETASAAIPECPKHGF